ncbi:MAG: hypothetical protein E3J64_01385 [Anaerolineales bacterium]|nr:MAG: hypothetical protein E3J64_01385 [Anaerolineales bacterium]
MRANRLVADGQYAEAAGIFEQLANRAEKGNMPIRAAQLSLQATRAHLGAGDVGAAAARAKRALRLLAQGGRPGRIPAVLDRITEALRDKGYNAEADQLEQDAAQVLEEIGLSLEEARRQTPRVPERRGTLPAGCGGCGAPLVPDDVEWHDAQTAQCPYCGMIAKTA